MERDYRAKNEQANRDSNYETEASDGMNITLDFDVYDELVHPAAVAEHVTRKVTAVERLNWLARVFGGG